MAGLPGSPGHGEPDHEALLEFLYLVPIGIIKFRPDGRIGMANPAAAQLLVPLAQGADLTNIYRLFADLAPDLRARIQHFRAPSGQICDQVQLPVPGTRRVLTLGINKIDPDTLMAVVQDITRAIEQESRLRDNQQRFRAIFENIRDYAIYTANLDGRIDEWNRSLNRLGGWNQADATGASIDIFFPPGPLRPTPGAALLASARLHGTAEFEGWGVFKDGTRFWGNTVAAALPDREGHATGYVLVTRDLTERKHTEDRLMALATTDSLTGAYNRRAGEAALDVAFALWQRHQRVFAVLMLDVDHFKTVNDKWGHDAGDQVLIAIVRACRDTLRVEDVTIRWGGEEFLLLLPDTSRDRALAAASRLRLAIGAVETPREGGPIRVTVSIGLAGCARTDTVADDILRRADRALYRAKGAGRNQVAGDGT